ncbi:MAG: hypothetical protein ACOYB3_09860, partial [Azonexus sp.]
TGSMKPALWQTKNRGNLRTSLNFSQVSMAIILISGGFLGPNFWHKPPIDAPCQAFAGPTNEMERLSRLGHL